MKTLENDLFAQFAGFYHSGSTRFRKRLKQPNADTYEKSYAQIHLECNGL